MNICDLREKQRKYVLSQRALLRELDTEAFELIFESATAHVKVQFQQAVDLHDLTMVRTLFRKHAKAHLELLSYRDLRKMASKLGVHMYGTLTKGQLITRVEAKYGEDKNS